MAGRRSPIALLRPYPHACGGPSGGGDRRAVYGLIHHQVKTKGPESMPELYMTLAPFVGAKEAYERAMEESDKW